MIIDMDATLSNVWILLPMSVAVLSLSLLFPRKRQLLPTGLVNLGNTCFANSVLQALASCPSLIEYLKNSDSELDLMVLDLAEKLNELSTSPSNPTLVLNALSMTSGSKGLLGYQQQDAHEFLVSLTDQLSNNIQNDWLEMFADTKKEGVFLGKQISLAKSSLKLPVKGYLAMRLCCQTCGYKTPITHESFDNLSLTVEKRHVTTLYDLLANSAATEIIDDWSCDKCTLIRTLTSIQDDVKGLKRERSRIIKQNKKGFSNDTDTGHASTVSPLKEKIDYSSDSLNTEKVNILSQKLDDLEKDITLVQGILEKDLELPLPSHIKKIKSGSPTLKRTLISRPPSIFTIHLQRSIFDFTGNIYKNNCRVDFPEYLDIKEFSTCTDGFYFKPREMAEASNWKNSLYMKTDEEMSRSASNDTSNSSFPEKNLKETCHLHQYVSDNDQNEYIYLYKLNAIVLHYGSHDSGHFVTYRRFPKKHYNTKWKSSKAEKWYAISDDHVRRIWDVEGEVFGYATQYVYLLFYERCRGLSEYNAQLLKNAQHETAPDTYLKQYQSIKNSKKEQ